MPRKSNAQSTLESSIIDGMSERPHLTGLRIDHADYLVPDLLAAIFAPSVAWAVRDYLKEIGEYDDKREGTE